MESKKHDIKSNIFGVTPLADGLCVGVVGYKGYSGQVLVRLLLNHPRVKAVIGFGRHGSKAEKISPAGPQLGALDYLVPSGKTFTVQPLDELNLIISEKNITTLFLATPPEVSIQTVDNLVTELSGDGGSGSRAKTDQTSFSVIDLSGAFRLDEKKYLEFYGKTHANKDNLQNAVYGLCPWVAAEKLSLAKIVANPGCYATSCLMALLPLFKENILDPAFVVIDGKSGATGAGKKSAEHLMFSELNDNCWPYRVGEHQHLPEIQRYVGKFSEAEFDPSFVTHVLPLDRGLMTSIYGQPIDGAVSDAELSDQIEKAYAKHYGSSPLVFYQRMTSAQDPMVSLKAVRGTARTHLGFRVVKGRLFLFSCIDNLMKGAASQAIENWNLKFGWPTQTGLLKEF